MDKEEIVSKIRAARLAHVQCVQRAKSLVNGFPINEEDIPLTSDACVFGQWFYSDGQILLAIFNEKVVKDIERLHNDVHSEYLYIFRIYVDPSAGFLAKFLKHQKRISATEQTNAVVALKKLEKISDELIKNLNIVETKINMADPKTLEKYV